MVTRTSPPPAGRRLADPTLGQKVYQNLQACILNGEMLPGTKLTLRGLASTLHTSIQPVREAIGRLAADGALEVQPNRAITVPRMARDKLDDLYGMRLILEGEAAARFAERATEAEIAAVNRANEALRRPYQAVEVLGTVTNMQRFALAIAQGSRSDMLQSAIFAVRLRFGPHLAEALGAPMPFDPDFLQFTIHMNDQLLLAFRDRDAVRARDLRRADILTFRRVMYARLGLLPQ